MPVADFFSAAAARQLRPRIPLWALCALSAAFFYLYTLPYAYHLDTIGHLESIQAYLDTGRFSHTFRLANTYLYLYPVRWLGEIGLKVVMIMVIASFSGCYFLVVKRDFGAGVAFAAAIVLLTAPATTIPVTHLKEDYNALLFLALAMLFLKPGVTWRGSAASGACYGAALLLKEFPIVLAPFLFAYLHVQRHEIRAYREIFEAGKLRGSTLLAVPFVAAALAAGYLIHPEPFSIYSMRMGITSPNLAHFLGPFSSLQPAGYGFWNEAILHLFPYYLIFLVSVGVAAWRGRIVKLLYFAAATMLFVILSNSTTVRARHYAPVLLFLSPLIVDGLWILAGAIRRAIARAAVVYASAALLAAFQLKDVLPTLEYRLRYNPHAEFYLPLRRVLPADALLLGMDGCLIATRYTGRPCRQHPVDADAERYQDFARKIGDERKHRPIFLLPDFFSYDRSGALRKRFSQDFKLNEVFVKLSEDYHAMTYGPPMRKVVAGFLLGRPSCRLIDEKRGEVRASALLSLDLVWYSFSCGGETSVTPQLEFRGHLTFLAPMSVHSVD